MGKELGNVCSGGFSFFGITNRLISHDLRNILAIISETLGLMEELVELSEKGVELKPGKLRSLNESILEEVERANVTIRNMNVFAHSVDNFLGEADIAQSINLMCDMARLDTAFKKSEIRLVACQTFSIYTSPFFFQNLIYQIIINYCAGSNNEILISLDSEGDMVKIAFSGINLNINKKFPAPREETLAKILCAQFFFDASAGKLSIILPHKMDENPIFKLLV
ncbi:MAG: hypothetical protein V1753_10720 [Pseudomonadota bacterium]